jgi:hypothetical protein
VIDSENPTTKDLTQHDLNELIRTPTKGNFISDGKIARTGS